MVFVILIVVVIFFVVVVVGKDVGRVELYDVVLVMFFDVLYGLWLYFGLMWLFFLVLVGLLVILVFVFVFKFFIDVEGDEVLWVFW